MKGYCCEICDGTKSAYKKKHGRLAKKADRQKVKNQIKKELRKNGI